MHSARISIVMPTLNQAPFIEASVRSALGQGVAGLELVVMDGGSSDGTLPLLARLAGEFGERLRWFSAPDSGAAQAVNRAVAASRGALIGWLNSDDLYAPGAVARAIAHLERHADQVMVYGNARHVDEALRSLGAYPSLRPEGPVDRFKEGCFICQPTMFFRREAWEALGGLDETLRASFDFDLWLRAFARFEGRIGFIDECQACSRLHAQGITLRERGRVAVEGMRVLSRHFGSAPVHWLLTHFEERLALHPFEPQPASLQQDLLALAQQCGTYTDEAGRNALLRFLQDHRAISLSTPELHVGIDADGWARGRCEIRIREMPRGSSALRLRCVHARPGGGALDLQIESSQRAWAVRIEKNGPFDIALPLQQRFEGQREIWRITTRSSFVPADVEPGSTDRRDLAFRVEDCTFA